MTMKKRTQERVFGMLFVLPVLSGVLLFSIAPILTTFTYSLTDYNPLSANNNRITVNLQEELDLQLGLTPQDAADADRWNQVFDPAAFFDDGLGLGLKPEQRKALQTYFDRAAFARDLASGSLNRVVDGTETLKNYLQGRGNEVLPDYAPAFVGTKNFETMLFQDQYFWITLGNTVFYALFVVLLQTGLAVVLAVAANSNVPAVGAFKLIFFLPSITSSSAISMIFWMLYSKPGVLNQVLVSLGGEPVDWLNDSATALPAVMAMNVWTTAGFFMITFLAGLQSISPELYESAALEGAKGGLVFRRITLPLLRPQILYVAVMGTIGCLQVFDQIYYLIPNLRNATLAYYIYKNAFAFGNMGYASALAVVLFLLIFTITLLQRRFVKESLT